AINRRVQSTLEILFRYFIQVAVSADGEPGWTLKRQIGFSRYKFHVLSQQAQLEPSSPTFARQSHPLGR
ncbi:hypothetical protein, partial [Variovorax beijingensis]|uniref:hypothetical protein n=1 Tax=Variovorax beijingensis TaxID=2496117 RepID=UPI00197FDF09